MQLYTYVLYNYITVKYVKQLYKEASIEHMYRQQVYVYVMHTFKCIEKQLQS